MWPFGGRGYLLNTLGRSTLGGGVSLLSAEIGSVNSSTVVATFSKPVAAAGDDYSTGMTIKVNGEAATISTGTRQANQAVVYYALSAPALSTDTLTIEYAAASGGITDQTTPAKDLASFGARSVRNNIEWVRKLDFSDARNSMYLPSRS